MQFLKRQGHEEKICRQKYYSSNSINTVEVEEAEIEEEEEFFAVKRGTDSGRNDSTKKPKFIEEIVSEDTQTNSRVRTKKITNKIKFIEEKESYSIKDDLGERRVEMSFAQLLDTSPTARVELIELCRAQRNKSEVNIATITSKTTNCRALVRIFGNTYWTIIDTGAACSVVTEEFAADQNISVEKDSSQVIITADGKRHKTIGKIQRLPIKIAGNKFPATALVMPNAAQDIILGVDWLIEHGATINLEENELILPKGNVDVVLSLTTNREYPEEESECFGIAKISTDIGEEETSVNEEVKIVLEQYGALLVGELDKLGATNVIQHEIDTGDTSPIRVRPYKLPHAEAVRALKIEITAAPVLAHSDWEQEFLVTTDSSLHGVGAILSQKIKGLERPLAYASRSLKQGEKNYFATHLEGLTVIFAVKYFKN
ncbi:Retrovirus-related Pol polyprotein from transposon [Smittium culicis]|uniref:Retrovirus-related Pol polyprotein from transposon n=1 Tax=Smittium culicis TaxID=133412 RepID=A0A1R1XE62_9FUNG|nr:Retrovirus-related Pol polyprotein from transposon [Smittium culicis]